MNGCAGTGKDYATYNYHVYENPRPCTTGFSTGAALLMHVSLHLQLNGRGFEAREINKVINGIWFGEHNGPSSYFELLSVTVTAEE